MPQQSFFIDLHCHPNYKSFARAHTGGKNEKPEHPASTSQPASVWFYDPPTVGDKLLNYFLSITKFRQANLTAAHYANLRVIVIGLGCVEKFFFRNKLGTALIGDLVNDFVAGFRKPRIDAIQNMENYWNDFLLEKDFMEQGHNRVIKMDGQFHTYKIACSFNDLIVHSQENEDLEVGRFPTKPFVTSIIYSSEGLHILNCGLEKPCDSKAVLKNARALKAMTYRPWFVTFAHHFYNELAGHSRSLRKQVGKLTNQEEGLNTGFTPLGLKVLNILLDNKDGKRIFIDVKHLSPQSRKEYYAILDKDYPSEIPVIISHGVCNGMPTHGSFVSDNYDLGKTFINELEYDIVNGVRIEKDYNEINFYDDEILRMVRSGGIMGLQLDERRIANDDALKKVKKSVWKNKIMHYRSELVWRQIQYMAELLDKNGLYAWGNLAIGSDYDGMVDPLNSFWTVEEFDDLMQFVERHAWEYLKKTPHPMQQSQNQITADKIVENFFYKNSWDFFSKWF
jgi:hypothetical protein